ncbi:MAG: polysaccharide biosynthesis tyrosine autokinase [candidate division Zixibacteria bacterium]|nr:polysaccharide biosynthesis tyrosine autokinase [candidate division Zixibacteria bacterium]
MNDIRVQDYIGVIYRKKWIVVLSFFLVFGISLYYAISTPSIFLSSATIRVDARSLKSQKGGPTVVQNMAQPIEYYDRIFKTNIFRQEVIDSLKADTEVWLIAQRENIDLAEFLKYNLELEADVVQTFFKITAYGPDAMLTYQIARISSRLFEKRINEIESESNTEGDTYLAEKLDLIRNKLGEINTQIQQFSREHGIFPTDETLSGRQGFIGIQSKLDEIQIKRELTQTKLRRYYQRREEILGQQNVKTRNPDLDQALKEIRNLAVSTDSLEEMKRKLTASLGQTHASVIEVNKQIRDLQTREQEINVQINTVAPVNENQQLPALQTKIVDAEQALFELSTDAEYYEQKFNETTSEGSENITNELELQRLMYAKSLLETNHDALIKLQEEEHFQRATQSGGVKMIDPASLPNAPIPSTVPKKIMFGAIIGLCLGLGSAFFLEYMDSSLKTSEDVTQFLEIPLIGEIPQIKDDKTSKPGLWNILSFKQVKKEETYNPRLIAHFSPKEPIPEAYRNVRTSLQYTFVEDPLKCIVISSPNASEGKSLTTSNLAIGFAQSGKKIVIVDTDLRRPVIHKIFDVAKEPGITEVLTGQVSLQDALKPTFVENLFILPAGHSTPNPGELISSQRMDTVLEELKQQADLILMDSPPVIAAIDAAILGTKTQGILLVFNMDETKREAAQFCIEQIRRAGGKVIGGLLNNIDVDRRYGYYYSYRYYYRYKYYSRYYYGEDKEKKEKNV